MGPCSRRTRSTVTKTRKVDTFKTKKKQNTHQFQTKVSSIKNPRIQKSRNCLSKKNQGKTEAEAEVEDISNTTAPPSSPLKGCNNNTSNEALGDTNTMSFCCLTPKSEKFRIPEITTCPPAPKKQRVIRSGCAALKRTPVSFYATPELELFFLFGLPKI